MKIAFTTIEALATRNYEANVAGPWQRADADEQASWLEEAIEQCEIVFGQPITEVVR